MFSRFRENPIHTKIHLFRIMMIIIMILSFDIAPFPHGMLKGVITFNCQRIDVDIHINVE